jgi:hypothetical protein
MAAFPTEPTPALAIGISGGGGDEDVPPIDDAGAV